MLDKQHHTVPVLCRQWSPTFTLSFCLIFVTFEKGQTIQAKKNKRTNNNDLQNTTQKTKDRTTQIQLKIGGNVFISIVKQIAHL